MSEKPRDHTRERIVAKLLSPAFRFPDAVAHLFASTFEPRTDGTDYPEVIALEVQTVKSALRQQLLDLAKEVDILQSIGEVEEICIGHVRRMLALANEWEASDMAKRLQNALEVCRGEGSTREQTAVSFPSLPSPRELREGRPPIGRWR